MFLPSLAYLSVSQHFSTVTPILICTPYQIFVTYGKEVMFVICLSARKRMVRIFERIQITGRIHKLFLSIVSWDDEALARPNHVLTYCNSNNIENISRHIYSGGCTSRFAYHRKLHYWPWWMSALSKCPSSLKLYSKMTTAVKLKPTSQKLPTILSHITYNSEFTYIQCSSLIDVIKKAHF